MGTLVHLADVSLDLSIEHEHGSFDGGAPSDELSVHPTNLIRPLGTHLDDRHLDETTAPCETGPALAQSDLTADFAGIGLAATRRRSL